MTSPSYSRPTFPDGNRAASDLTDVVVSTAGPLAANVRGLLTATGTYTAPTPASVVTNPPQKFALVNRTTSYITVQFPNPSGTTINLMVMPGAVKTFRQATTSGYDTESGNDPLARLDERYLTEPLVVLLTGAATLTPHTWNRCNPTSAAFTVTLPAAPYDGAHVQVENTGTANVVTVARGGTTDTIEGSTTLDVTLGSYVDLTYRVADTTWYRRRRTPDAIAGTDVRRDLNGRFSIITANGTRAVGSATDGQGIVIYASGWGTRPTGYASVQWIGGTSGTPPTGAVAGDTWTRAG